MKRTRLHTSPYRDKTILKAWTLALVLLFSAIMAHIWLFHLLVQSEKQHLEKTYQEKYTNQDRRLKQIEQDLQNEKQKNDDLRNKLEAKAEAIQTHNLTDKAKQTLKKTICDSFGQDQCQNALTVQSCEDGRMDPSRINVNANKTIDVGLFQINSIHTKRVEAMFGQPFILAMTDPFKNIRFAHEVLFKEQGFGPWYSSGNCQQVAQRN